MLALFQSIGLLNTWIHILVLSSSLLGPVDPSFRAPSGRPKFTVRRHNFNKDSLSLSLRGACVQSPALNVSNEEPRPTEAELDVVQRVDLTAALTMLITPACQDHARCGTPTHTTPKAPWKQLMVSPITFHAFATRIGWHLWEIDLRFSPGLPPRVVSGQKHPTAVTAPLAKNPPPPWKSMA